MRTRTILTWIGSGLALAGAGGAAWVYTHYARDLQAARARLAAGRRVIETACGPIEYGESGSTRPERSTQ